MRYVACSVLLLFAFRIPVSGQDKAKVKCGPNDTERTVFKEAETINFVGFVACGREVEILDAAKNAYKIRYDGQTGYVLPDAIDGKSLSAPVNSRAAQESRSDTTQESGTKPLTNADIIDMLDAGLSQEVVVAKIKASTCSFDTSPGTLKSLKTKGVPDSVIVAMVQAPTAHDAEPKAGATPASTSPASTAAPESTEAKQAAAKRHAAQAANDDFEDCRVRAQNEYDAKMNAMGNLAVSPMMRVVAANKLKQNLDAELRQCRAQYEARIKAIEAK